MTKTNSIFQTGAKYFFLFFLTTSVYAQTGGDVEKQKLAESLLDENCSAMPRSDVIAAPGLPQDKLIYCDENLVGKVTSTKFFEDKKKIDDSKLILEIYYSSSAARSIKNRMSCSSELKSLKKIKWKNAYGFGCKLKNGGWPHLLLLLPRGKVLYIADGSPSLFPTLISAVYPKRKDPPLRSDYVENLQDIFGDPVPLASSSDLKNFNSLLADARVANTQARYRDSESLFRKALDLQSKLLNNNDISIAETLLDLALNVSNQGRDEEALALFRRAEPIIQVSPNDADRARFASYQGYHEANSKRYEKALQFSSGAVSSWRKIVEGPSLDLSSLFGESNNTDPRAPDKGELALALNLQANMALRVEELALAQASASEALQILKDTSGLPKWWMADILLTLGKISSAQGRLSASEKFLTAALAEKGLATGDGPQLIPIRVALAKAYQVEGMNTSSIITYRQIFKKIKSFPLGTKVNLRKQDIIPFALAITNHSKTLKDENEKQGLFNEAFDAFQLLRPTVVEETVNKASTRLAINNPDLSSLIDAIQIAERERDAANIELSYETSLPDDQRSKLIEDKLILKKKIAYVRILQLNQKINKEFPGYSKLIAPKTLETTNFRERLGATEGVVSFITGEKSSFVLLIRRNGLFIGQINEGEDSISESVQELRKALVIQAGSVNEFDQSLAFSLHNRLFGGIQSKLADLNHLIIIPTGPLASLPFALLIDSEPKSDRYSEASWLVNRVAISHSPSLNTFYSQRTIAPAKKPIKPLLAFGNPSLSGFDVQKDEKNASNSPLSALASSCRKVGPASADLIRSLAPLPETEQELKTVGKILSTSNSPSILYSKDLATEENLRKQSLNDYKVLYFATHGLLPGELKCQTEPGLVMTPPAQSKSRDNDGLLEASEIASLRINADIVVLSACNTAGSSGRFGGDSLSGLAEAFFFAGARSLVVSHWQVPSRATASLMSAMFESLGPDLKTGSALSLRDAQKSLIKIEKTAHPFFWAAFVVVGDGIDESWLPLPRETPKI